MWRYGVVAANMAMRLTNRNPNNFSFSLYLDGGE